MYFCKLKELENYSHEIKNLKSWSYRIIGN